MHTQSDNSRQLSRNRSSPGDITNIQTWISQPDKVQMTLSHFSVKACGLVLHPWKCGCHIRSSTNWKSVTFRAINIYWKYFRGLGTNWACHMEESLFQPRTHVSLLATLYSAGSTLCNDRQHKKYRRRNWGTGSLHNYKELPKI